MKESTQWRVFVYLCGLYLIAIHVLAGLWIVNNTLVPGEFMAGVVVGCILIAVMNK